MSMSGSPVRKPLGQWLLEERVVDGPALKLALAEGAREGRRLGEALVAAGLADARDVGRCLALQHDLLWLTLAGSPPAADALRRVPVGLAQRLRMVPVRVLVGTVGSTLLVAAAEPPSPAALEELAACVGMAVEPALCTPAELDQALGFYDALQLSMMPLESDQDPGHSERELPTLLTDVSADPDPVISALVDADVAAAGAPTAPGDVVIVRLQREVAQLSVRVAALEGALEAAQRTAEQADLLRAQLCLVQGQVDALLGERHASPPLPVLRPTRGVASAVPPPPPEPTPPDGVGTLFDGIRASPPPLLHPSVPPPLPRRRSTAPPPKEDACGQGPTQTPFASLLAEATNPRRPR